LRLWICSEEKGAPSHNLVIARCLNQETFGSAVLAHWGAWTYGQNAWENRMFTE
jgi:hypothetical protein